MDTTPLLYSGKMLSYPGKGAIAIILGQKRVVATNAQKVSGALRAPFLRASRIIVGGGNHPLGETRMKVAQVIF